MVLGSHGKGRGCVFASTKELARPEFDMTEMTAVSALWRFVIVLLLKRFVTPMTQS